MHVLTESELRQYAPSVFAVEAHESRSERFAPIATIDVIKELEKERFLPVLARQSRTRDETKREFTRHMVRFRREDNRIRTLNQTFPEVVLTNANDGTSAWCLRIGIYRYICLNGATIEDANFGNIRIKHKGNRQEVIDNVIDATYKVIKHADTTLDVVENWQDIDLDEETQLAFAELAHSIRFNEKDNGISPEQLLHARRWADKGNNLWLTYNRIQENCIKGKLEGRNPVTHRKITTRELKGIDQDIKFNIELFNIATMIENNLNK